MKTAVKTKVPFDSDKEGIRIVKVAAFCFSIISWIATAEGLNDYVFDLWWEAYLISFGIQSILFVFNLKLPQYFKKMKWFSKIAFVILYIVILVSSSIFSFVYICTSAMYSNSIGYTDADIILNTQYSAIKEKTTDYIREDMKALLIVAGIQISQMQEGLPKTDSIPFEELQQIEATAKYEYELSVTVRQGKETAYQEAQKTRDALYDVRYARASDFQEADNACKAALTELSEAQSKEQAKKSEYEVALQAVNNYEEPHELVTQDFLTELLKAEPDPDVLSKKMKTITDMVLNLGESENTIESFNELVQETQSLNITIEQYLMLKEVTRGNVEDKSTFVPVPNPESEDFESQLKLWQDDWNDKFNALENVINNLPSFSLSNILDIQNQSIDVELLQEYDSEEILETLSNLKRENLSGISDVEKSFVLLLSKYPFTSIFSLILAIFFDVVSLMAGLFVHSITVSVKSNESL